ncbi:MAG: radical SAM protein [bacterium]
MKLKKLSLLLIGLLILHSYASAYVCLAPSSGSNSIVFERAFLEDQYQNYRQFQVDVQTWDLPTITTHFKAIDDYLIKADHPHRAFASLHVAVRNAYCLLIVTAYINFSSKLFLQSAFLDMDRASSLYSAEKYWGEPVKKYLNDLIDGDERLAHRGAPSTGQASGTNDFSFATVGMAMLRFLFLNGIDIEHFSIDVLEDAPKVIATNAIKDNRDIQGDRFKHSMGNRHWPFIPASMIEQLSILKIFGVDARYYNLSAGADTLEDMLKAIDEDTIISYGFRDPIRPGDMVTLKNIAAYCARQFPGTGGPLISSGGVAAEPRKDLLEYRVFIHDGQAVLKQHPNKADPKSTSRKLIDILHRTYGETNLLDLSFGYWTNKAWDDENEIPEEVAKLPNAWYLNPDPSADQTFSGTIMHTSARSLNRLIAVFGSYDQRVFDLREYWRTRVTPPEQLHDRERYFSNNAIPMQTSHGNCNVGCDFCAYPQRNTGFFKIPIDLVLRKIKEAKTLYPELNYIVFYDSNFLRDLKWAREFFKRFKDEIYPMGISMFIEAPVYYANDAALVQQMRESGVEMLCFGQEGVGIEFLQAIGKLKKPALHHLFQEVPRLAKHAGIQYPRTSWILFHPKKDQEEVVNTIERVMDLIMDDFVTYVSVFAGAKPSSRLMQDPDEWATFGPHTSKYVIIPDEGDDPFISHQVFLPLDLALREVSVQAADNLDTAIETFRRKHHIQENITEQIEIVLMFQQVLSYLKEHPNNTISPTRIDALYRRAEDVLEYLLKAPKTPLHNADRNPVPAKIVTDGVGREMRSASDIAKDL